MVHPLESEKRERNVTKESQERTRTKGTIALLCGATAVIGLAGR
jgi:hypothetical protein